MKNTQIFSHHQKTKLFFPLRPSSIGPTFSPLRRTISRTKKREREGRWLAKLLRQPSADSTLRLSPSFSEKRSGRRRLFGAGGIQGHLLILLFPPPLSFLLQRRQQRRRRQQSKRGGGREANLGQAPSFPPSLFKGAYRMEREGEKGFSDSKPSLAVTHRQRERPRRQGERERMRRGLLWTLGFLFLILHCIGPNESGWVVLRPCKHSTLYKQALEDIMPGLLSVVRSTTYMTNSMYFQLKLAQKRNYSARVDGRIFDALCVPKSTCRGLNHKKKNRAGPGMIFFF